jgi:biotin-(acetyl-CoA carboxylase) ligase
MITFGTPFYDRLGSTQDEACRLAQARAAHGTVVTVREQMAGRGRHGRCWATPTGNLYLLHRARGNGQGWNGTMRGHAPH